MSTLVRLRDFTADRDSVPPVAISADGIDNEFDQIISESNAQDIRITAHNTRLDTLEAVGNVSTADIADDAVTPGKISFIDDATVATDGHMLMADGTDFANVAISGVVSITNTGVTSIADDAITTAKILNSNVTFAKLPDASATNKVLGRVSTGSGNFEEVSLETVLTSTDEAIPTSKAVRDDIISLVNDVGGFVAIADDQSFPNANPDPDDGAGTVVSIANAGGLVVSGSGSSTTARTLGASTVTINGIPSDFYSTTIADGLGMQVVTTTTLNTYNYHRITAKEDEINTVATNISNVNATGGSISSVNTVAGQITPTNNISTLGGLSTEIGALGAITSDITTCSTNSTSISTTATNISGVNSFADRYRVGATDPTTSLDQGDLFFNTSSNELKAYGTSWQMTAPSSANQANINIVAGDIVYNEDLGSVASALTSSSGTGDIATCATNITNINNVGGSISSVNTTASNITPIGTCSTNISSITTVSNSIADVNRYAAEYIIASSAPGSPTEGDLWYDESTNSLKYHDGTSFNAIAPGISELVQDPTPELASALDCNDYNVDNCGTIDGTNLQIDFGGLT